MQGPRACRAPTAREKLCGCRGAGCRPRPAAFRLGRRRRRAARTMSRRVPAGPGRGGPPCRLVNESDGALAQELGPPCVEHAHAGVVRATFVREGVWGITV